MSSSVNKDYFKIAKKGKKLHPPSALSHDALLAKSMLFAKRSVEAKQAGQDTDCQLWAAAALELLAKTQLAGIHPSLIVEAENHNSLLEANGISTGTAVRTIGAAVAYTRLKHTVPHFSTPVFEECKKLAERRNAELHSGDAACAAMPYEAWEGDFWNAADLILDSMDMDLQEWLGADAKTPKAMLKAYRQAEAEAAKQRVKHHASEFKKTELGKLGKEKFALLVAETKKRPANVKDFRYQYSHYWYNECPSCKTIGVVAGDEDWEQPADDQSGAEYGYLIIERAYSPSEFHCPTCGLSLVGDTAVNAAGITEGVVEVFEEEIAYEPEYGND
ncbi:hypothetical protein OL229_19055 [Neisseriaceae bacterium JH1-16]|nr:hypothetical protein [Neisseriaceae bacterium JH1-16]